MLPVLIQTRPPSVTPMAGGRSGSKTGGIKDIAGSSSIASSKNGDIEGSMLTVLSLSGAAALKTLEMQIGELFAVYDFLKEGTLSEEVFLHAQKYAAELSSDAGIHKLPSIGIRTLSSSRVEASARKDRLPPLLSAPSPPSSPLTASSQVWQRFAVNDRMDFQAFSRSQLELRSSKAEGFKKREQRLKSLIWNLAHSLSNPRIDAWKTLDKAAKAAKHLHDSNPSEAMRLLDASLQSIRDSDIPGALDHEKLLNKWKVERKHFLSNSLVEACTLKQLQQALQAVEECGLVQFEDEFLDHYRGQLVSWQKPFMLHVTTMVGAEAAAQVERSDTVEAVRERVAWELGIKGYRLSLASVASNKKLEPPSATLEELGICDDEALAGILGKVDRWQELGITEFLELATSLGVLKADDAAKRQAKFDSGTSKRHDVQTRGLIIQIERQEEALRRKAEEERRQEEERRRKEEAERLRLQQIKKELQAAAGAARTLKEGYEQNALGMHVLQVQLLEEAKGIKTSLDADLGEVLPAVQDANEMILKLSKADVLEIRMLKSPPWPMKQTMEALCILFQVRPERVKTYEGRIAEDYWMPALKCLISSPRLLEDMLQFDKNNIPDNVIKKLSPLIWAEDFSPDIVRKCSRFCEVVCIWIQSIFSYHFVWKAVEPKVEILKYKEEELHLCCEKNAILAELIKEVDASTGHTTSCLAN